jgi:outer membrane protein assembly factor BamB
VRVDFVTRQALVQTESPVRVYTAEGAAAGRQLTAGEHAVALPALGANSGGLLRQAIAALAEEKTGAVAAQSEATGPGGLEVLWRYTDFAVYRDFAEGKGVSVSVNCTPFEPDQAGYPVGDPPDLLHADGNVMFPDGETVVVNIDLQEPQDLIQVVVHSRQLKTFNGGCGVRKLTVGVGSSADGSDVRTLASRSIDEELPNAKVTYAIDLPEGTRGRLVRITAEPYSSDHNVYLDSIDVNGKAGRTDIAGSGFHLNDLAVADLDGDGADDILAAGTDRAVHAVDSEGTRQWMQRLPDTVNALALFRSAPGTRPSVAAACDNHQLYAFDAAGAEVWSIKPPPRTYARAGYRGVKPFTGRLTVAFAADLEKDGADEILVGSANWRVYCFAADGTLKWDECCWAHTPTCGTACDLDGDGTLEVIMGNSYTSTQIYSTDGKLLGTGRGSSHAGPTALACADTDHNGKAEMVVGDKAGRIWFQEWEGRKMPDYNTGMDISAVTMHDLDGDGQQETLVASQNFLLYAFGPDGQPLWRRNLLDACRDIQCGDVTGDGKPNIVLACEDGTVRVLDAEGNAVALFKAGGWMRQVRIVDLDGDPKTYELVAACDDGSLYALQMTR